MFTGGENQMFSSPEPESFLSLWLQMYLVRYIEKSIFDKMEILSSCAVKAAFKKGDIKRHNG